MQVILAGMEKQVARIGLNDEFEQRRERNIFRVRLHQHVVKMAAEVAEQRGDMLGFAGAAGDFQRKPGDGAVRLRQIFANMKIPVDDGIQRAAIMTVSFGGNDLQQQHGFSGFSEKRLRQFFDDEFVRQTFRNRKGGDDARPNEKRRIPL